MEKPLQVKLAQIEDELKKVVRRQEEMQKSMDLLFADRAILEDLQGSMKHLQEIILSNQQHQDTGRLDIKADIKDVQKVVENKLDEAQIANDENTMIVKSANKGVIEKIKEKFQ